MEAPNINSLNETETSWKLLGKKSKDLSGIINTHIKIVNLKEEKPENNFHNKNVINLGNFLENESNNFNKDIWIFKILNCHWLRIVF